MKNVLLLILTLFFLDCSRHQMDRSELENAIRESMTGIGEEDRHFDFVDLNDDGIEEVFATTFKGAQNWGYLLFRTDPLEQISEGEMAGTYTILKRTHKGYRDISLASYFPGSAYQLWLSPPRTTYVWDGRKYRPDASEIRKRQATERVIREELTILGVSVGPVKFGYLDLNPGFDQEILAYWTNEEGDTKVCIYAALPNLKCILETPFCRELLYDGEPRAGFSALTCRCQDDKTLTYVWREDRYVVQ